MTVKNITCKDLSIRFGDNVLFAGFSASFNTHELNVIKGLNGSGKSSLLKVIAGLESSAAGKVLIDQKDAKSLSTQQLAMSISYVGARQHFTFPMSVYELLKTGRYLYQNIFGQLSKQDEQLIAQALEDLDIQTMRSKNIQTLSDGELQQVLIALALVRETPFILLDEPTSFLDYQNKEKVWKLLMHLKTRGKGIIIASHDIAEMEMYADNIIQL